MVLCGRVNCFCANLLMIVPVRTWNIVCQGIVNSTVGFMVKHHPMEHLRKKMAGGSDELGVEHASQGDLSS